MLKLTQTYSITSHDTPKEPIFRINKYRKGFLVSKRSQYFLLKVEDIAYFILDNKMTFAVTFKNEFFAISKTLEMVEKEVNPNDFFRTNRNTIINLEAFGYFENYFNGKLIVKLKHNLSENIIISRAKSAAFKLWLDQ
ncbi:LytR/AlgR family response regulator transcription factor [Plebeiibacterium sediminum]|uniref:LytTR family transcriptional regulator n=1 Tax=Plebeiibacterium sediminum TaxID=2992112 RepID=A0AAE3SGH6_9BACT|nr:LytTR family DNA-binding domain-containing protein [Plebeiobacterium sediminum]MCW3787308.1 LytTR family transcriptional regulator [Plebeiobacterium sediminum]